MSRSFLNVARLGGWDTPFLPMSYLSVPSLRTFLQICAGQLSTAFLK
jgi:hypothetical protein